MAALYSFASQHPISVTNSAGSSRAPQAPPISTSQTEDQLNNIYDSDFTQGSLSPTSCHAGPAIHPPPPPDPSLFALIPHEMFNPPTFPADLLWHCSIGGGTCTYIINLCAPSDANLRSISTVVPQDEAIYLLEKQWKSTDEQVCMIFHEMVNAHWEDHLKELDIKHVDQGDTVSNYFWSCLLYVCAKQLSSFRVSLNGSTLKDMHHGLLKSGN